MKRRRTTYTMQLQLIELKRFHIKTEDKGNKTAHKETKTLAT